MSHRQIGRQIVDDAFGEFTKWVKSFRQDYDRRGPQAIADRLQQASDGHRLGLITTSRSALPGYNCTIDIRAYSEPNNKLVFRIQVSGLWAQRHALHLISHHGFEVIGQTNNYTELYWYI